MRAELIPLEPQSATAPEIERAVKALREGALVVFPTETVYGLAANAAIDESVDRLRAVKGRDSQQPFTVHIGSTAEYEDYVPETSSVGRRFASKGWPGPLTLIFNVPDPSSAAIYSRLSPCGVKAIYTDGSVGIRHPDHPATRHLLCEAGVPVIASSANVSGGISPVEAGQVVDELGDKVDFILDDGETRYRKNSTIVEVNGDDYTILREGVWDERTVRRLSTLQILFVCTGNTCRSPMAEGMCKQMLSERLGCRIDELPQRGLLIQSAGTLGISGGRVSPESVEACRKRGIDISAHTSQGLSFDLVHQADHIFAMARHHLDAIRAIIPAAARKATCLDADADVADPIGGTLEDYERSAQTIQKALERRMNEVSL